MKYVIRVAFNAFLASIVLILSACGQPTGDEMINDQGEAYFLSMDHADMMILPWKYASPLNKLREPVSKEEADNNDRYYKGRYNKLRQLIEILEYRQQKIFHAEKIRYYDNGKVHSTITWIPNQKTIVIFEYDFDGRGKKVIKYFEKIDKPARVSLIETLLSFDQGNVIKNIIKETEINRPISDILKELYGRLDAEYE